MADTQESLDKWRNFFRTPEHDIFDIIEHAIIVAATDFPSQLKIKRERITEMLFAYKNTNSIGWERVGLNGSKESKVTDPPKEVMNVNQVCRNGDAEVFTEETDDEESKLFDEEVLRIKEILDESEEQSSNMLCDSLRKIQLMNLSLETLEATRIGKSVNALRKYGSKDVKTLATTLIADWKNMLNAWINASKATEEVTPEPVKASKQPVVQEEIAWLPSPPLEEGIFLNTPITMELPQVFEGLDNDGNLLTTKGIRKNRDRGRKLNLEKTDTPKGQKVKIDIRVQQKSDKSAIQKKHEPLQREILDYNDETSIQTKIESSKRKLHERYEELEKAKRQKTVRLLEFKDLPKQKQKQTTNVQSQRPGNRKNLMNWATRRH